MSSVKEVATTIFFLVAVSLSRLGLDLLGRLGVDNYIIAGFLALVAIVLSISLFFNWGIRRIRCLTYLIDIFMLVGCGLFFWQLTVWQKDVFILVGFIVFIVIIACMISIFKLLINRKGNNFASSEEIMEIDYFLTKIIWLKMLTFLVLFSLLIR
jgi:hypothetical protein